MARHCKKVINTESGTDGVNAASIPADIAAPTNYTKTGNEIKGHLEGINTFLADKIHDATNTEAQDISGKTFTDGITLQEVATPSDTATGDQKLYPKSDGLLYSKGVVASPEIKVGANTDAEVVVGHLKPTSTDWKVLHNEFTPNRRSVLDIAPGAGDTMGFQYSGNQALGVAEAGRFGICEFDNSGSLTAGYFSGLRTNGGHTLKGGDYSLRYGVSIKLDAVPTATSNVVYLLQLGNSVATFSTTYIQIGAAYSDNATNFTVKTRTGGTITTTDTGIAMDTAWHSFEIHMNVDWTEAKFYIDGTLEHTQTVDLPSTADFQYSMATRQASTVLVGPVFSIDWAYIAWKPASTRDTIIYLD